MTLPYSRDLAFSRTIGMVTRDELVALKNKTVAIAGLGGVGGHHLETLARLGVGRFRIGDFDHFEIHNINRQIGAKVSTLGQPKCAVMSAIARDINPEIHLTEFEKGIHPENIDAFLDGADLYVDGLDFFAFDARALVFAACARKGIPAITVAPLGMGAALLNFMPGHMTFEQYFRWAGCDDTERAYRMLVGLAPKATHRHYVVDPTAVNLAARRGPSTPMACHLCTGIAGTEALKILLGRGKVYTAPHSIVFDAYYNRVIRSWSPGGLANPILQLKLMIIRRVLARMARAAS